MTRVQQRSRPGALLICVLVCLLVASAMVTATTRSALQARREIRHQQQMRQTLLLLDAGVLRAAGRVKTSDSYKGETWRPTEALGQDWNPSVEIRVSTIDDELNRHRVEVIASLGRPGDDRPNRPDAIRRSHTFTINRTPSSKPPSAE